MKKREHERRDSGFIIIVILLFGFIFIILASGWALRFAPNWKLDTNMGSKLNPNSDFLKNRPSGFFEPVDPAILTHPAWFNVILTPGASFTTSTPIPTNTSTIVPSITSTPIPPTLTIPVATNTLPPIIVVVFPTNTKTSIPPPPPTPIPSATNTPVTPPPSADLQITKTDNATDYIAGISVQYIIVASNPSGPSGVTGATVTDTFSTNLDPLSITWVCAGSGGASCTANGTGNINDTVNLPVGGSVQYTVNATVVASPLGPLANLAAIDSVPAGITDPNLLNNFAPDIDQLVIPNSPGNIGSTPDNSSTNISPGTNLILQLGATLTVGSHASYDLVYYPDSFTAPALPALQMDVVILQIGNGSNWYTILNWGNGSPNTNTDIPAFPPNPTDCTAEPDNCVIAPSLLTTFPGAPGISIDLDGLVPNGTYNYIRIFSRANPPDSGDGVDIDAITILP